MPDDSERSETRTRLRHGFLEADMHYRRLLDGQRQTGGRWCRCMTSLLGVVGTWRTRHQEMRYEPIGKQHWGSRECRDCCQPPAANLAILQPATASITRSDHLTPKSTIFLSSYAACRETDPCSSSSRAKLVVQGDVPAAPCPKAALSTSAFLSRSLPVSRSASLLSCQPASHGPSLYFCP